MSIEAERAQYFTDLVRRWQGAVDRNDFKSVVDTQRALTRLGAYYNDAHMAWELNENVNAAV